MIMFEHFPLFNYMVKVHSYIETLSLWCTCILIFHIIISYILKKNHLFVICWFDGCFIDLILNDLDLSTDRWPRLIKSVTQSWGHDKFLLQFVLVYAHKILTFMPKFL